MFYNLYIDLENYKILNNIGNGSYGSVYYVENKHTHEKYAAKVFSNQIKNIFTDNIDIFYEYRSYIMVNHPSIVHFYGLSLNNFQNKPYPVILLEYVPKGSLEENIHKLTKTKRYIILLGVALGMQYLHKKNIIHRDLKCDNILLDDNFYPRICDFGLSYSLEIPVEKIKMDEFVGSIAYMAPEILRKNKYTSKIDVFSFAIVAYEIIVGKFPYKTNMTKFKFKNEILNGMRPDLSVIKDPFIQDFLKRCWSNIPQNRPTFDEIVDIIQKDEFKKYFQPNENDVSNYYFYLKKEKKDVNFICYDKNLVNNAIKMKNKLLIKSYAFSLYCGLGVERDQAEALRLLKIAADFSDDESMFFYAQWIQSDYACPRNYVESTRYFKMAADHGNVNGMFNYADHLQRGIGVPINLKESAKYNKMAADLGDADAMGRYADALEYGNGIPQNLVEAEHYYKLSAEGGNYISMYNYANKLYIRAQNCQNPVERNNYYKKAAEYYKISSENGVLDAKLHYSMMIQQGLGIDKNEKEATKNLKSLADLGRIGEMILYASNMLQKDGEESAIYFTMACKLGNDYAKKVVSMALFALRKTKIDLFSGKKITNNLLLQFFLFGISVSANMGDVNSQIYVAYGFYKGIGFQQKIEKAIHYYTLASDHKNAIAQCNLGIIYSDGKYTKVDIEKAIYFYLHASNQKNSIAQNNLGLIYLEGKFVKQNIKKAIEYLTLSANQKNSMAQNNLGVLYCTDKYNSKDINKSLFYLNLALYQNNSLAQYNIGILYLQGQYFAKDINKAIHYFTLASNQKLLKANLILGILYFEGKYIQKDFNKAIHYFSIVANQKEISKNDLESNKKISIAHNYLGLIYLEEKYEKQNIDLAIKYFTFAANLQLVDAQYNLGIIYSNIKRNVSEAINYFSLASNQNDPYAQNNLGVIYHNQHKIKKAIEYLSLSADQDIPESLTNLGLSYYHNIKYNNKRKYIKKMIDYFLLAVELNDPIAQNFLGVLYLKGRFVQQNIRTALDLLALSADQNYSEALFNLGIIYYVGQYDTRNVNEAVYYLKKAANNNYVDALFVLGLINFKKEDAFSIENSINYFLKASSLKDKCSTNNIGVIYKNGFGNKLNINQATHFFTKSICDNNDEVSMYNLAHFYFFNENYENYSTIIIKLLIKSSLKQFKHSKWLLCLTLLKIYKEISYDSIFQIMKRYQCDSKELALEIYSIIQNNNLKKSKIYEYQYKKYSKLDFIYNFAKNPVSVVAFKNGDDDFCNKSIYNITKDFYLGFGLN